MPARSSLARLLQLSVFAQLTVACAWLLWRWPAAEVQAVAGACLLLLSAPLVLGIELVLMSVVDRFPSVASKPTAGQLFAAWLSESAHFFRTFWWRQPFRWRAVPDQLDPECAGRTGVVFVHGFMCNRGFWNAWMQALRRRGHGHVAVNLEPVFGSIDAYATIIDDAVKRVAQATGRPPLLVCHSMGGLAARAWWRACGSEGRAAGIVTIATPHGGTWMGRFSSRPNGRQMRLASDWLRQLAQDEASRPLPPMTCWHSNCDNIVFPTATAMLAGADNRYVPAQPHVALALHPLVMEGTFQLLGQASVSNQGNSFTGLPLENG